MKPNKKIFGGGNDLEKEKNVNVAFRAFCLWHISLVLPGTKIKMEVMSLKYQEKHQLSHRGSTLGGGTLGTTLSFQNWEPKVQWARNASSKHFETAWQG